MTDVNDPPVAIDDPIYTVSEDGPTITGNVSDLLANDTDQDSPLPLTDGELVSPPAKGVWTFNDLDGTITYDPNGEFEYLAAGETEYVTFTYRAFDDEGAPSNIATVTITVTGVNDAPVANDDPIYTVSEDGPIITGNVSQLLANDTDVDNPLPLTNAELVTPPSKGLWTVNELDGTITYDPNGEFEYLAAGETEYVTFMYRALDDQGAPSNIATVTITVTGVNDAPVANDDPIYTVSEDGPIITGNVSQLLANDTDVDNPLPLTNAELVTPPSKGLWTVNELDGTITYDPNGEFEYLAAGETDT